MNSTYQQALHLLNQVGDDTCLSFFNSFPSVEKLSIQPLSPSWLDICDCLSHVGSASSHTQALVETIVSNAPRQQWRQPYKIEDFGEDFYNKVAWFPIADANGPLIFEQGLMEVMLLDANTEYPAHKHQPEELYFVLAGKVWWKADGAKGSWKHAGEYIHHLPNVVHSIKASDQPVLILSCWRGGGFEMPDIV
ncbi:dimethylsulfonioproprionate lyase family protein [Vibrio sonorensis]|uniref:dimethylsulfonioproprionate lyase family protein n=1 Tax=Vibrio sonorensis TaxID=1004316 RepID=UPI0008DA613D|nr:dimethylsulfonioproprionate lyase family protein [Vibrio sonorensis]